MEVYVETRGSARSTGYRFLGGDGPAESWWRHRHGRRTAFEYPTVLVEHDADGWRVYLGGILSSRREPAGSTNRVTVVISAPDAAAGEECELVLRLVGTWVDDTAAAREPGRLQQALDAVFTEPVVARLYGEAHPGEVTALVREVAARLDPASPAGPDPGPSWIAPVRSATGRAAFLGRVGALVGGAADGAAVLVNLVDDGAAYERTAAEPETAVLVLDPDGLLPERPVPLPRAGPPAKKAAGPPARTPSRGPLPAAVLLIGLTVLVLLVMLLVVLPQVVGS